MRFLLHLCPRQCGAARPEDSGWDGLVGARGVFLGAWGGGWEGLGSVVRGREGGQGGFHYEPLSTQNLGTEKLPSGTCVCFFFLHEGGDL